MTFEEALQARLGQVQKINLAELLQIARQHDTEEIQGLIVMERLARSRGWSRYYVDRTGQSPRVLSGSEAFQSLVRDPASHNAWALSVEVTWAANLTDALRNGQ